MLSLVSSLITIVINVAYIVDVLRHGLSGAALLVALPYLLPNVAPVVLLTASLFSKPIKTDDRWSMFFIALVASNAFAVLHFAGVSLVSPNVNVTISLVGQLATLALVPFYVLAIVTLGKQLTVMPEARKLVTRGPYAVSRHPLYVTYIIWFLLQILVAQSLVIVAMSTLMVVLLVLRARSEETILSSAFPADYQTYCRRVGWVGRWTPRFARVH
jgi:protein-S-isoprenylcysteine O-methyltransferase Ste14